LAIFDHLPTSIVILTKRKLEQSPT